MPIYRPSILSVDQKETRRYAGLSRAEDFGEKAVSEACDEALLLASPRVSFEEYEYDSKSGLVFSDPPFAIEGRGVRRHLAAAEGVIFVAATVGRDIEDAATRYFEDGRYSYSVVLDAAATAAAEQTLDLLEAALRPKYAKAGIFMTARFSPGYGDWDIRVQREVLRIAGGEAVGISLTESMMLLPRKSVTAVIGLVREGKTARESAGKGCARCEKKDCHAREINQTNV